MFGIWRFLQGHSCNYLRTRSFYGNIWYALAKSGACWLGSLIVQFEGGSLGSLIGSIRVSCTTAWSFPLGRSSLSHRTRCNPPQGGHQRVLRIVGLPWSCMATKSCSWVLWMSRWMNQLFSKWIQSILRYLIVILILWRHIFGAGTDISILKVLGQSNLAGCTRWAIWWQSWQICRRNKQSKYYCLDYIIYMGFCKKKKYILILPYWRVSFIFLDR